MVVSFASVKETQVACDDLNQRFRPVVLLVVQNVAFGSS